MMEVPPYYAQKVKPFLVHRFDFGPSFYFIYHYQENRYIFVEDHIRHILQYQPADLIRSQEHFFLNYMHPDDTAPYQLALQKCKSFFDQLPPQEHKYYTTSIDYRFRKKNGDYIRLLQQIMFMAYDNSGNLLFRMEKCTDISHWQKSQEVVLSISGTGHHKNMVYYPARFLPKQQNTCFTPMETRILKLLAHGLNSRQIAERLNISFNTVNTHRRNMRKKTGVRSTTSLLHYFRQEEASPAL